MIFFDTETCGLHGFPVLVQYALNDGPIELYSPWGEPIWKTLELIEMFCNDPDGVVGFNLVFDWFQMVKTHTVFSLVKNKDKYPIDIIQEIAELEPLGRDGLCVKPKNACDIMLHARRGPYQSTMDREDIRIRRVPTSLAWQLADELESRVKLKDIYFSKRKDKSAKKWQVYDIKDDDGDVIPAFKDVVLSFRASSALKALAADIFKLSDDQILKFTQVELNDHPEELGYAPYALALAQKNDDGTYKWNGTWPSKIREHHRHWAYMSRPRQYAADDVKYTRDIWRHFGSPLPGDDDSILACMVAAVRWRGFAVDLRSINDLKNAAIKSQKRTITVVSPGGVSREEEFEIPTSPDAARWYINQALTEDEKLFLTMSYKKDDDEKYEEMSAGLQASTKKVMLQALAQYKVDCPHCQCSGVIGDEFICAACDGRREIKHPAAYRAEEVLAARQANYAINIYDKFLLAGRFHASLKIIGALSSRMAGADGLNPQGIGHEKTVRRAFPLAFGHLTLMGGDFDGFEVTLADAAYGDENLRKDLKSGKKIHALFGIHVYPGMTYEEILKTAGTADDRYDKCKKAIFAMFYGGEVFTLMTRLGVSEEVATKALMMFRKQYPGIAKAQKRVEDAFISMKQPGGIGTKVIWHEPHDFAESLFGFKRYFTLENMICKTLFELSNKPPKSWQSIKIRVQRRDRFQTASGALQSALYGAAFGIQSANKRAAANHEIQSSGATITKMVQRKIWDPQPSGVSEWKVQPLNIHDELMCPTSTDMKAEVKRVVDEAVESVRPKVPLIKMEWKDGLKNWADK